MSVKREIMNEPLVNNEDFIIDVLDNNNYDQQRTSDVNSVISDMESEIIRKNTKLNTLINTHVVLSNDEFIRLQNFYAANQNNNIEDLEHENKREIIRILAVFMFIWFIGLPFIFCDLYYGYGSNSCVNHYSNTLKINMKTYLLVNAYASIIGIFILNFINVFRKKDNLVNDEKKMYLIILFIFVEMFVILFISTWNIIGSVIFWTTLYNQGKCDKNISTYLFVSFIVKLLISAFGLNIMKNKIFNI